MPENYVPIFIFVAVVVILIPLTLAIAKLVRPEKPEKVKLMPYECGVDPIGDSRQRYTVRFYIVAILFVIFDVETIPLSLGGAVQSTGPVRFYRDDDLSGHPHRGLRVDLEEGSAGVDLTICDLRFVICNLQTGSRWPKSQITNQKSQIRDA